MSLETFVGRIDTFIITPLIFLLSALGLAYFIWGMTTFIWTADSEEGRKKGVQHMLWGIIGMFVILASFGIINIIKNTFSITDLL